MPFLLRIDGPSGVVSYDASTLLHQDPSFASEYEQGRVTQPNATLSIPEGIFGIDGADLRTSGLEGTWRCEVRLDDLDGPVLLDGTVARDAFEWDALPRNVVVKAVADAADAAKERLKAVRLNDLPPAQYAALVYRAVDVLYPIDYAKRGEVTIRALRKVHGLRWYNLLSVVQQVFAAAGLDGAPDSMFSLSVEANTGGSTPQTFSRPVADNLHILSLAGMAGDLSDEWLEGTVDAGSFSKNSLTLPAWDGWTLVEGFCKLCGLTFDARYEPFPSEEIVVTLIPDTWAETEDLPAVDALWDEKLYTERRDPPKYENLAVVSAEGPGAPDLLTWGDHMPNVTTDQPDIDLVFLPPALATRGVDRWAFDADGKPLGQTEVKVPFVVAGGALWGDANVTVTTIGDEMYPVTLVENAFWADGYLDGTDDERCYLASLRPGSGTSHQVLLYRRIVNAAPGQLPNTNETWMREAFRNYRLSRVVRDVVEGTLNVDDVGAFVAGTLDGGAEAFGQPWLAERVDRTLALRQIGVRLTRPAFSAYPDSDQPYFTGAVTNLRAKYTDIEAGSREKELVTVSWEPPAAGAGRAILYDVQRYRFASGLWEDLLSGTIGTHAIDFERDDNGRDDGEAFALYRVRARYPERAPLPVTVGPWTEVRAYIG